MVQINLLPDVKRDFLHARQQKHTFVVASILVSAIAVTLLALIFAYVQVVQPRHLANLQNDIDDNVAKAKQVSNAVEMVTVQGALDTLPSLQDKKQISSRLFGYITSVTPVNVSFNEITLDTTAGTISLKGETTGKQTSQCIGE